MSAGPVTFDLRSEFVRLAPERGQHTFDVDEAGGWWLCRNGRPRHARPWWPTDRVDVLVAVTLLHMLDQLGPVPITGEYLRVAEQQRIAPANLRCRLMVAAYSLFVRHLLR
ncbi:hypothetical protein [Nonomuraea wenchangensis]|uniref:hypothetical protein n=1 Tax=Nonomuraea wenchangensis TaxID=568860 RepID=UPI0033C5FA2A